MTHPGEVLLEEFMKPLNINSFKIAKGIRVPANRVFEILRKKRSVTADTALRLSRFFGTTPEFWMNLQSAYDLEKARLKLSGGILDDIRPWQGEPCSTN